MDIDVNGRKTRLAAMVLVLAAAAVPFLAVRFAPVTDLPQQVAQIRLLTESAGDPASPYAVDYLAPNHLSYAILGLCWKLFSPLSAGRLAMLALLFLFTATLHHLAMKRNLPLSSTVLATAFFFGPSLYWGFYSFILGFPVFLLAVMEVGGEEWESRSSSGKGVLTFLFLGLLLLSHSLWFAAAVVWLGARGALFKDRRRDLLPQAAAVLPLAAFAGYWYVKLQEAGFDSPSKMSVMPWERLAPSWLVDWSLGGPEGWVEPVFMAFVLFWAATGLWQARGRIKDSVDKEILLPALIFILFSLFLPTVSSNTTLFAQRWLSPAFALLLLGLPAPSLRFSFAGPALALAAFLALVSITAKTWTEVEKNEFSGLEETLAALPENSSVLGLDYLQKSAYLKAPRPFLQTFAYAQVAKGASLSFSFADYANSLVYFDPKRERPWTRQLTWFPNNLKAGDLKYFSYVIAGGKAETHESLLRTGYFEPVTASGAWRLYRSKPHAGAEAN